MQTPYQASQAIDFSTVPDNSAHLSSHQTDGFLGGWFTANFMNKVVEKAKYASETVITTLDPGMKQVLSINIQFRIESSPLNYNFSN